MKTDNNIVSEINLWAMRDGVWLGLMGVITLSVWRQTILFGVYDIFFLFMLIISVGESFLLTWRYRRNGVGAGEFSFGRGFFHALLTGFYASIWVALVLYLYLRYYDHGMIFAAYAEKVYAPQNLQAMQQLSPEWTAQLNTMSGGRGAAGLADTFRSIGAATYATMPLYAAFTIGPIISALVGLVFRRNKTL